MPLSIISAQAVCGIWPAAAPSFSANTLAREMCPFCALIVTVVYKIL